MTMKNRKTLAAVAVVLLALALVFVAPVSAEGDDVTSVTVTTLEDLQNNLSKADVSKIVLSNKITITSDVGTISADHPVEISAVTTQQWDMFAVESGGKVTFGKNITIKSDIGAILFANNTGEIIVDGATILSTSGTAKAVLADIKNNGKLTVNSGTITGSNKDTISVKSAGSVTVIGGTISGTVGDTVTIAVKDGATATINGGTITSSSSSALYVEGSGSTATISGGEVTTTCQDPKFCAAFSRGSGKIIMNGGTVSAAAGTGLVAVTDGIVEVSGGIVNNGVKAHENANAKATISGGTINGNVRALNDATVTVTGGSFTDPTVMNYLGENAYVEITLQENFDITSTIDIDGEALLDLNGYDITGTGFTNSYLFAVNSGTCLSIINSGSDNSKITSDGYCIGVRAGGTFLAGDMSKFDSSAAIPVTTMKITFDVVSMGIAAYGFAEDLADSTYTVVYLDEKTVIETDNSGITIYGQTSDNTKCFGVEIFFNGEIKGTHPTDGTYKGTVGIATNGYIKEGDSTIILGPQAKITAATGNTNVAKDDDAPAIMANGYATWLIAGSALEGDEAVSMKAGKLAILDGTFKATGTYHDPSDANNGGSEMTGAAISVTNTYAEGSGESGVDIMIMGGTFESTNGHAIFAGMSDSHTDALSVLNSLTILKLDDLDEDSKTELTDSLYGLGITIGEDVKLSFKGASEKDAIQLNGLKEDALVGIAYGSFSTKVNEAYFADNYHNKQVEDDYKVTNEWTVTFNSNGGSTVDPVLVVNNTKVTQPTNPTKTNYKFDGWFTDEGCTTAFDFDAPVTADITLNAKWTENKQTNTGSSSSGSSSSNSKPADTPVEPETPAEPEAGEPTVETEVTDGGEVALETTSAGGSAAAADEEEAKVTGVVLPTGTEGKVTFIPISEQPAPAGKETQTKKVFEINIPNYEKGKAAVIKFQMTVAELEADGKTAAEVALWHFDEETGEWTKLVTSYTIVDGVVYFEAITNDFSPFAIVYEDAPVDEPTEEPVETPAPILAVLAGLGAAVVLRRK